jgi:hypothetical protein
VRAGGVVLGRDLGESLASYAVWNETELLNVCKLARRMRISRQINEVRGKKMLKLVKLRIVGKLPYR